MKRALCLSMLLSLGLVLVLWGIAGAITFQYFDNTTYTYGSFATSPHDFKSTTAYGGTADIASEVGSVSNSCRVCHTPHNVANNWAPLWGHATTSTTFTIYTSGSMQATEKGGTLADGVSKACLSCHDGTIAIITTSKLTTGGALIGTSISDDHPVGITYDATLVSADGELATPTSGAVESMPLFSNKLECGTCHDVHNTEGANNSGSDGHMLRWTQSALCGKCHVK